MIYAQVHNYGDGINTYQTVASRTDQPDSTWHPFDVPSADWLYLSAGAIAVHTQAEMDAAANAEATKTSNTLILAQIDALEAKQPRAVREAALNKSGALDRLTALDTEIATLRAKLV